VTAGLAGAGTGAGTGSTAESTPDWGRWFRQVETVSRSGAVLMQGAGSRPLLTLDRVENGRIGVLTSDHIWLWARGYEGGGPQAKLVRRLAHWLMKEPTLEEERLSAVLKDSAVEVTRRSMATPPPVVSITTPAGETLALSLETTAAGLAPGLAMGRFSVSAPGVYRVDDGVLSALAAVGSLNPLEYQDLRAMGNHLTPLSERSGGGVYWLSDGLPEIRRVKPDNKAVGSEWIGLRANQSYVVSGVADTFLLPWWLSTALTLVLLFSAWWREGR
jgi:hypothetical protein